MSVLLSTVALRLPHSIHGLKVPGGAEVTRPAVAEPAFVLGYLALSCRH